MLHSSISRKVLNVAGIVLIGFVSVLYGCRDTPTKVADPVIPPEDSGVSFSMLSSIITATDTNVDIRVSWKAPNDPFGAPEFYRHTMVASKVVTDSTTGNLPTLKQINGLADTVRISLKKINDTVTLTSSVWSVRRGLQSTTPGVGRLFVRRGDRAPLPPDSIRVDTIVIPSAPVIGNMSSILFQNSNSRLINEQSYNSMFGNYKTGVSMYKSGNTTYLTIIPQ
jgi:hypothetical protein